MTSIERGNDSAQDGDRANDEEGEGRVVDEARRGLVLEDGEEGERDDERTSDVAFAVEDIAAADGFEEEEGEEDQDLGDCGERTEEKR